jgi:plastocyanin
VSHRTRISVVASLAIVLIVLSILLVRPAFLSAQTAAMPRHHMAMTQEAMKQRFDQWRLTHKPTGVSSEQVAVAQVNVGDFYFDADNNPSTVVDTVHIHLGDTVTWNWVTGFHTVTSGTDSGDPNAGLMFDQPLDNAHTSFSFQFNTPGYFPYFCFVHEGAMAGYVHVWASTGVPSSPVAKIGFTRDPSPNPTHRGVSFAFTLSAAGRVQADVFDANGRRVVRLIDIDMTAGAHNGSWDGRRSDGHTAEAGVYYLRLRLPGYDASRRVTVTK